MLEFLKTFSDAVVSSVGIDLSSRAGISLSFFIEDTIKIFLLIYVMLFVVSLFRSQLHPEKIKLYLSGKSSFFGYILAVFLGVVTPFCSCSSIPMFIAFTSAGIPFGITMAFLIASPLISEVAAVLLLITPEAGYFAALIYVLAGAVISITGGYLCDKFHLERLLEKHNDIHVHHHCHGKESANLIQYANNYAFDTVKEIGPYVLIGLAAGALIHGYIPEEFFIKYLGAENPFSVVAAAVAGIPIYANHDSVLPFVQVLLMKGVPVGTTIVALMSITAISLPEMIMLHKVLSKKILWLFVGYLFVSFIIVGYIMNYSLIH